MDSVSAMAEVHKILEDMRERRGAPLTLMLYIWSSYLKLNEKGMPVILVRERGTAERMIESFMLVTMNVWQSTLLQG